MSFQRPKARFLVARDGQEKALATGALVLHDGWAEIKRMWVEEAARGQGIAREILNALMAEAGNAGVEILRLETGMASHAALALYEKTGFKRRAPLADYRLDPLSVFMERLVDLRKHKSESCYAGRAPARRGWLKSPQRASAAMAKCT